MTGVTCYNPHQQADRVSVVLVPRLKELRRKAFMTQTELADKSGLAVPTIKRLEAGKTGAHFSTIKKLAGALDVKPDELVKPAED